MKNFSLHLFVLITYLSSLLAEIYCSPWPRKTFLLYWLLFAQSWMNNEKSDEYIIFILFTEGSRITKGHHKSFIKRIWQILWDGFFCNLMATECSLFFQRKCWQAWLERFDCLWKNTSIRFSEILTHRQLLIFLLLVENSWKIEVLHLSSWEVQN